MGLEVYVLVGVGILSILFIILLKRESEAEKYLFASRIRSWLDIRIERMSTFTSTAYQHVFRHGILFVWYKAIHGLIRGVLTFLEKTYLYLDGKRRTSKRKITNLVDSDAGDTHLREMRQHKTDSKLTDKQRNKMKSDALE